MKKCCHLHSHKSDTFAVKDNEQVSVQWRPPCGEGRRPFLVKSSFFMYYKDRCRILQEEYISSSSCTQTKQIVLHCLDLKAFFSLEVFSFDVMLLWGFLLNLNKHIICFSVLIHFSETRIHICRNTEDRDRKLPSL